MCECRALAEMLRALLEEAESGNMPPQYLRAMARARLAEHDAAHRPKQ